MSGEYSGWNKTKYFKCFRVVFATFRWVLTCCKITKSWLCSYCCKFFFWVLCSNKSIVANIAVFSKSFVWFVQLMIDQQIPSSAYRSLKLETFDFVDNVDPWFYLPDSFLCLALSGLSTFLYQSWCNTKTLYFSAIETAILVGGKNAIFFFLGFNLCATQCAYF